MFFQDDRTSIVKVEVKGEGDVYNYDEIEFSSNFSWTESDRKKITEIITDFYNSFDRSGEKLISTSFGEVLITHEKHPSAPRMKLILGFMKEPLLTSTTFNFFISGIKLSSVLKSLSPDFIKENLDAIEYLDALDKEVKLDEAKVKKLEFDIFDSILKSLENKPHIYAGNEASSQRLSRLIGIIKTFYPEKNEDDSFNKKSPKNPVDEN